MSGTQGTSSKDQLIEVLKGALDRQADSMDAMSKNIPAAMEQLRGEMSKMINRLLFFGVVALVLMAGLVGTQIVLQADSLSVNTTTEQSP